MRNTVLILLFSVFQVLSAGSYAQTKRISLAMNDATISEVLYAIQNQSEFYFLYNSELIDVTKKVDVKIEGEKVDVILARLFSKEEVDFLIKDRYIVLTPVGGNKELMFLQQRVVSGKVTDSDGLPLPGVTVVVKGTTQGTVTDTNGEYTLRDIPDDTTLQFSFVGMLTQEIKVGNQTSINVTMEVDAIGIEEVVAIGYGTMKKSDLTGSVSSVKTENLQAVPVYNVEQALKTGAAGVRVSQNSGAPGSRMEVRIRGGNSMIGDNQPLYVVDGFPVTGGIDFLNPSDIESIDILKDASATAIYGARGANGVVIITSKKGKIGQKGKIEVESYYGSQQETKRYKMLDAKQYAQVANEWLHSEGIDPFFDVSQIQNPGTDWQDLVFRKAPVHNHTITFSGSSETTRYSLSGNYYEQDGIIINSGVKKGSFRLNLNHDMNDWLKMAVNLNLSRREINEVPVDNRLMAEGILAAAMDAPPTLPVYDENGIYTKINDVPGYSWINQLTNPLIWSNPYKDKSLRNSVIGNTSFEINLTKDLIFKTMLGLEYQTTLNENFSPIIFDSDRGSASESMTYRTSFLNENILTYSKTFNDIHSLNLMAGYTYQTNMTRFHSLGVNGFSNNITENFDLGAAGTVNPPSSGIAEWKLASWLSRVNYSLNNKYMFTASIRADGSSRFGADNKWGYFPSGAFAWRVSNEPFMEDISFISNMKLRTSYGLTGNTALSPYQSLNRLSSVKYIYGNAKDDIGIVPTGISNSNLKWETTAQLDVGIDIFFLDNKLQFTFDYYKKNTSDLLASVPLPPSVGFGSILRNLGEIQNEGVELSVQADILSGEFKWNISGQASTNKNKIVKLAGDSDIYGGQINHPFWTNVNIARVGEPFGMIYGLKEDGLNENGQVKYIDTHTDGEINNLDRVIIGNPYPKLIYGLTSNFSYKNFDLSVLLDGVYGNDIFWATAGVHLNSFQGGHNQLEDFWGNYWTEENPDPNAKYPKIDQGFVYTVSDRFIEDGSFLRLRSLKLAYNVPLKKEWLNSFNKVQIYLLGTNLLTVTNYPGIDPETNTWGTDTQDVTSRLRVGIDTGTYPSSKTYGVGLKLDF